ncbi:hypothetical protein J6590_069334 [Homalodisca vitripennis]|nr:hypothetical protein J6590_069334 [Homalodisca vitripennis]
MPPYHRGVGSNMKIVKTAKYEDNRRPPQNTTEDRGSHHLMLVDDSCVEITIVDVSIITVYNEVNILGVFVTGDTMWWITTCLMQIVTIAKYGDNHPSLKFTILHPEVNTLNVLHWKSCTLNRCTDSAH